MLESRIHLHRRR